MSLVEESNNIAEMDRFSKVVVGPVMFEYTFWILNKCVEKGLKKVYFLARDAFLIYQIAKEICGKYHLDIDCRYLYCSRFSLRMPSYHLLGEQSLDILFQNSYYATPESLIKRAGLNQNTFNKLVNELQIKDVKEELSQARFDELTEKLKNSALFKNEVFKVSQQAYEPTIGYLKQSGLFDDEKVVIADSGWTGSMQRTLRQLMESEGYKGQFVGFYFGLNKANFASEDGEFLTYYFSGNKNIKEKVNFNNNVFECMLSANHGMTIGYEKNGELYQPIFSKVNMKEEQTALVSHQIDGALNFSKNFNGYDSITDFDLKKSRKKCFKILKRFMVKPTKAEVEMFSQFMFCDDVTECYNMPLTGKELKKYLSNEIFLTRLFRKLFCKKSSKVKKLFWNYGVVATCPKIVRPWYRFNIKLWDYARFLFCRK